MTNERVRAVEVMVENICQDVTEIRNDVKALLHHKITSEKDIADIRLQMRRAAGYMAFIVSGGINAGFLFFRAYLEHKNA